MKLFVSSVIDRIEQNGKVAEKHRVVDKAYIGKESAVLGTELPVLSTAFCSFRKKALCPAIRIYPFL